MKSKGDHIDNKKFDKMCKKIIERVSKNAIVENGEIKDTMNSTKTTLNNRANTKTKSANRYETAQVRHLNNYSKYEKQWENYEEQVNDHFMKQEMNEMGMTQD